MRNAQCCKVRDARAAGSRPVSHSANEAGRVCKTKAACPSRLAVVRHLATKWERTWAYILASHGSRRVGLGPPDVSMGAAEARKQSSAQSVSEATAAGPGRLMLRPRTSRRSCRRRMALWSSGHAFVRTEYRARVRTPRCRSIAHAMLVRASHPRAHCLDRPTTPSWIGLEPPELGACREPKTGSLIADPGLRVDRYP